MYFGSKFQELLIQFQYLQFRYFDCIDKRSETQSTEGKWCALRFFRKVVAWGYDSSFLKPSSDGWDKSCCINMFKLWLREVREKPEVTTYLFPPFKLRRNYLLSFHYWILIGISYALDQKCKWHTRCVFPVSLWQELTFKWATLYMSLYKNSSGAMFYCTTVSILKNLKQKGLLNFFLQFSITQ